MPFHILPHLEELHHRGRQRERLGLLHKCELVQIVLNHELCQVTDDLTGGGHLRGYNEGGNSGATGPSGRAKLQPFVTVPKYYSTP